MEEQRFDVVICGAGLAGLMLAAQLSQVAKIQIAIIEARKLPPDFPALQHGLMSYDPRVSAITAASQSLFEDLGLWKNLERKKAYQAMTVWDADGTGSIHFDAANIQQPCLGHIVENRLLIAELVKLLRYRKNVSFLDGQAVSAVKFFDNNVELEFAEGASIRTGLLVGADGANSFIRGQAGFETREWDYGHDAIVCTVETELPHQNTAWQRFLSTGPLAFLPLEGGENHFSSIVWSVDEAVAKQLMADEDAEFLAKLEFALESKLGKVVACSKRFSFPLRQRHAIDYVKDHVVLVGDAAHTIHPLAGQGINLGFQDVAVLTEELLRAYQRDIPLGELAVLQRYQRRRKPDNLAMMAVMEGFKRLFAREDLPVRLLRNFGMQELDKHSLAKRKIIEKAMGL